MGNHADRSLIKPDKISKIAWCSKCGLTLIFKRYVKTKVGTENQDLCGKCGWILYSCIK